MARWNDYGYGGFSWRRYVPASERHRQAGRAADRLRREGVEVRPVRIEGRAIARTFWGKAWCDNLESYSDFSNRLPRGRTYVRSGAVWHLDISRGRVEARVQGSECYTVGIAIKPLSRAAWQAVKERCAGRISSMLDLLSGRLSEGVMSVVTDRQGGLFPKPKEISMSCSCPDWAGMCKHVAATLYGVGARLDESPELLFLLCGVDHEELISARVEEAVQAVVRGGTRRRIAAGDVAEVFGLDVEEEPKAPARRAAGARAAVPSVTASAAGGQRRLRLPAGGRQPAVPKRVAVATQSVPKQPGRATPATPKHPARARPAVPSMPDPLTGAAVTGLRGQLGCTASELARLLGVSSAAVSLWERKQSPLKLQARNRAAFAAAWALDAEAAAALLASGRTVS